MQNARVKHASWRLRTERTGVRALMPNLAIDTDVLSAGCRRPTVRRSFLR